MLAIYHFKLLREGGEGEISLAHIVQGDAVLIHQAHSIHEFAVIGVVWIGVMLQAGRKVV
jgi:hypothetical protein